MAGRAVDQHGAEYVAVGQDETIDCQHFSQIRPWPALEGLSSDPAGGGRPAWSPG
jgi:hypothetical protein